MRTQRELEDAVDILRASLGTGLISRTDPIFDCTVGAIGALEYALGCGTSCDFEDVLKNGARLVRAAALLPERN